MKQPNTLHLFHADLHDEKVSPSLSKQSLESHQVSILNGRLIWKTSGKFVSTENYTGKSNCAAVAHIAAYAVDLKGNLYIHEHVTPTSHPTIEWRFFHSSFFGAEGKGLGFGMIAVIDGKVHYIDNESGHFLPGKQHLDFVALDLLQDSLAPDCKIIDFSNDSNIETPTSSPTQKATTPSNTAFFREESHCSQSSFYSDDTVIVRQP